jgi:hypothetical protein
MTNIPRNEKIKEVRHISETTNVLVAYFSCTGTTKSLAEYVAKYLTTDIYEIQAETPYTIEDLDYHATAIQKETELAFRRMICRKSMALKIAP